MWNYSTTAKPCRTSQAKRLNLELQDVDIGSMADRDTDVQASGLAVGGKLKENQNKFGQIYLQIL